MTTSPPETPQHGPSQQHGPRVSREEVTDLGRLRRTRHDRKVAGVAGGLARHLDIDPVILRVAFVVLVFFGGAGIILYAAVWLLVPSDGSDDAKIRLDVRSRTVALVFIGIIAALALLGDSLGGRSFPWPLAIIGLIVLLVVSLRRTPEAPSPHFETESGISRGAPPTERYGYTPPPPNPRKRGPLLFWFTMALIALAVGVLGVVDIAGGNVTPSAYPALALGLTGTMLLVGAFFGRAGGLILLGLLLALTTAGTYAAERVDYSAERITPVRAVDLHDSYSYNLGDVELDLTDLADPEALDGRTIEFDLDLGQATVIVPSDIDVRAEVTLDRFGTSDLFGVRRDGSSGNVFTGSYDAPDAVIDPPILTIKARASVGEFTVVVEEGTR